MVLDILSILWSWFKILFHITWMFVKLTFIFLGGLLKVFLAIPVGIIATLLVLIGHEMYSDKFSN